MFIGGIALAILSFFSDHAEDMPFVYAVIAPSYYHAKIGLKTLSEGDTLNKEDEGFNEIASIILSDIHLTGQPETTDGLPPQIAISGIQPRSGVLGFSQSQAKITNLVHFTATVTNSFPMLSEEQDADLDIVTERVNELRSKTMVPFSISIFFLGIVMAMIGFIREVSEKADEINGNTHP